MKGWVVRFKDGAFAGETYGPVDACPESDVIVWRGSGGLAWVPYDDRFMSSLAEGVHHYRRVRASGLTDEAAGHPNIVRGAEYEEVAHGTQP